MNAWSEGVPVVVSLSRSATQGPRAEIAALFERHGEQLFSVCARIVRDAVLAEDIVQQTMLEAIRDFDRFQGRSSLLTWVTGIAIHRCQDAHQARRRRAQRFAYDDLQAAEAADPGASPTEQLARVQLVAALDHCVAALSPPVRTAVLLRFQRGMSYEEMSRLLGVKADTLQARVARALPGLRRCLEAKGWNHAR